MDGRDITEKKLRDLADQFRAGRLTRRELIGGAGVLLGGTALASFLVDSASPATPAETGATTPGSRAATKGQPKRGGVLKVGYWSEPGVLDPVFTTRYQTHDVVCNFFEGLFADDAKYSPKPLLAESYGASKDGKTVTIGLRKGVTFHNGKEMTSADVLASMKRWQSVGAGGSQVAPRIDEVKAKDKYAIVVTFNKPTGLLPTYLALPDAIIVPEEIANAAGKDQMTEIVGTGPFKFIEHLPDRHIRAVRYDNYAARPEEPNGMAGRKTAYVDEIRFLIANEAAVRADGLTTGEYDFAGILNWDSYVRLNADPKLTMYLTKPYEWLAIHLNKKQGMFIDVKMRRAIQKIVNLEPANRAAFASPQFYRLDPGITSRETALYSDVGKELFNHPNLPEAKALLKEAGYKGEPVVWMTNKESQANYDLSLTFKGQLEGVGMAVDLQVMDTPTLRARREKPELWNAFITGHPAQQHPVLHVFLNPKWPGWWVSEKKDKLVDAILSEPDAKKVYRLVEDLQRLVYEEVALVKTGEYFILHGSRKEVKGYASMLRPFFYNVWME
jgi:peptide/nickel transport system substrate-binding protein